MADSLFIIAITPTERTQLNGLFQFGEGSVSSVLEKPGSFRYAGWDLQTLDHTRIVNGEFVEVGAGARKVLRLYEDGTLIVRGIIDENFLGWGTREETFAANPRVHALAVIEFTTAAVHLYKQILPFLNPQPIQLSYHLEITNGKIDGRFLYIVPHRVNTIGWAFGETKFSLEKENPQYNGIISAEEVKQETDKAAYELVHRLFLLFGVPTGQVPYTIDEGGTRRVNVAEIQAI